MFQKNIFWYEDNHSPYQIICNLILSIKSKIVIFIMFRIIGIWLMLKYLSLFKTHLVASYAACLCTATTNRDTLHNILRNFTSIYFIFHVNCQLMIRYFSSISSTSQTFLIFITCSPIA